MLTGKMFGMGAQNRSVGRRRIKRVENDEFVGTVYSSNTLAPTTFGNVPYPINPGQAGTFPWLSGEATQWEKYRFEYLEFYFEHDVSSFVAAGTTGKVIMSLDYDAADSPPTTKQQMEDSQPHADGMPNEDFGLFADPADLSGNTDLHYVRLAGLPGGADIRLYDVGNFNIATQGISGQNVELGELHVRYACIFEVPILSSDEKAAPANNSVSWFQSTAAEVPVNNTPTTLAVATATTNGLAVVNTAGSMVPPAGNYMVHFSARDDPTADVDTELKLDFQKNATSVYHFVGTILEISLAAAAGAAALTVGDEVYVTANGSDAFTLVVTAVDNAAGAHSVGASVIWTAV